MTYGWQHEWAVSEFPEDQYLFCQVQTKTDFFNLKHDCQYRPASGNRQYPALFLLDFEVLFIYLFFCSRPVNGMPLRKIDLKDPHPLAIKQGTHEVEIKSQTFIFYVSIPVLVLRVV